MTRSLKILLFFFFSFVVDWMQPVGHVLNIRNIKHAITLKLELKLEYIISSIVYRVIIVIMGQCINIVMFVRFNLVICKYSFVLYCAVFSFVSSKLKKKIIFSSIFIQFIELHLVSTVTMVGKGTLKNCITFTDFMIYQLIQLFQLN